MEVRFDPATMLALSIVLVAFSALDVNADVPDGVVYTDVRKVVIEEDDAVLKCQFRGTPLAVYWKKGSDPESAPNLITWVKDLPPAGSCVEDGACEMADDFSLILKEVGMEDQGRYICQVANYKGILIYNFTDVKVIDSDRLNIYTEPYVTGRAGSYVNLPCNFTIEAEKVLWKRVYWDDGSKVETILRYTSDGHEAPAAKRYSWSKNYGLIIRDVHVSDEGNFTCLVLTTDGIEIKNSTALVVNATQSTTVIIVVVVIVLVVLLFIIYVVIRTRQYKSFTKEKKLDNLRKNLKKYQPWSGYPSVINLGVFGLTGAGKSTVINSINFALTNEYNDDIGAETKFRDSIRLTKHINIVDNRGMKDISWNLFESNFMPEIRGERGQDPDKKIVNGDVIHCPIFVHDISGDLTAYTQMQKFLKKFSSAVHDHYGRHVMVVFTHKEEAEHLESRVNSTSLFTDVPVKHIWSFENYTEKNDNYDVGKSIDYLEFLEKCLKIGERNIKFEMKKKQEVPTGWCMIQ